MLAEQNIVSLRPIRWSKEKNSPIIIDQTKLPYKLDWVTIESYSQAATAIKDMLVRGAPLIGITAAYGMYLACRDLADLDIAYQNILNTRPTAVNLHWALARMARLINKFACDVKTTDYDLSHKQDDEINTAIKSGSISLNYEFTTEQRSELTSLLLQEAIFIQDDDFQRCKDMGDHGAEYIKKRFADKISRGEKLNILTHCNAGALATGGYGTALGVIRSLYRDGLVNMVFSDETRPRQQGSRLTVWELAYDGIPVTMNADNMVAALMQQNKIDLVVVGSDRITANGDVANKIGTYSVAILADYHKVPFYVAAPISTVDFNLKSGDMIPIEFRSNIELSHINDKACTYVESEFNNQENHQFSEVEFFNPGFDVTPNKLVEAIFTEQGLFEAKILSNS